MAHLSESDKTLPQYVQNEFEDYLKCGRLEHGFLGVQCESCHHEPLDFIARLAALVPKPRVHLTRFRGVFAPNSKHRATVTGEAKEKRPPSTAPASP